MYLYCKSTSWWQGETLVSTYYSNGKLGNRNDGSSSYIRCVRDWNPPQGH